MRVAPTSMHKKIVIKWENVLLIPTTILAISGIIKADSNFITIAIIQNIIILASTYYLAKITRLTIQKKGLFKAISEFITFK